MIAIHTGNKSFAEAIIPLYPVPGNLLVVLDESVPDHLWAVYRDGVPVCGPCIFSDRPIRDMKEALQKASTVQSGQSMLI